MRADQSVNSLQGPRTEDETVLFATSRQDALGDEYILRGDPESLVATNIE